MSHASESSAGNGAPTWWVVFTKELHELWIGGRALTLLLVYTLLLGIQTYVLASNSELSLIPPNEMVYETLKGAIAVGMFISLIIGADMISGERERATLEGLLLTPTSRLQIILGKFAAAASPWPAAMLIAVPYMATLAQGDAVLRPAIFWGAIIGSVLAPAFTGLGMLVSYWCNTNKTSLFVSLGIYILMLLPSQLPGRAQTGAAGALLQKANPVASHAHYLSKVLVNNRTFEEFWGWLVAPAVFAVIVIGLLLVYAGPGMRLEAARAFALRVSRGVIARASLLVGLLLSGALVATVAQTPAMAEATMTGQSPITVTADLDHKLMKTTDFVVFNTTVTNGGTERTAPLIAAMNIINLDARGDVVDPEDWSPQRTQYVEAGIAPGESATLSWRINAILDGDYMVYLVVIPSPTTQDGTSQPVSSQGVHLTVTPFTRLNPRGVLPYAIGGPLLVLAGILLVYRRRQRGIDRGGA